MKRPTPSRPKMGWDSFEFAVLHSAAADSLREQSLKKNQDDEEERVSVEVILHRMVHGIS